MATLPAALLLFFATLSSGKVGLTAVLAMLAVGLAAVGLAAARLELAALVGVAGVAATGRPVRTLLLNHLERSLMRRRRHAKGLGLDRGMAKTR